MREEARGQALLRRAVDGLNAVAAIACHLLLVAIVSVIVLQVFLRFVLNSPTSWSEEVALLFLIWFGLLAVAVGVRRHEHVAIHFLRDLLPAPLGIALDYATQVAIGVFMLTLVLYGDNLVALVGVQVLPASSIPKAYLYFPVIAGGLLGLLNAATNLLLRDVTVDISETLDEPPHG
jgi:TRAP-type transport system small permease protein